MPNRRFETEKERYIQEKVLGGIVKTISVLRKKDPLFFITDFKSREKIVEVISSETGGLSTGSSNKTGDNGLIALTTAICFLISQTKEGMFFIGHKWTNEKGKIKIENYKTKEVIII